MMKETSYVPNTLMLARLHSQHMHQNTERKANSYNEQYLHFKINVYFKVIKTTLCGIF
jgi:hypothetical protein